MLRFIKSITSLKLNLLFFKNMDIMAEIFLSIGLNALMLGVSSKILGDGIRRELFRLVFEQLEITEGIAEVRF